MNVQTPFVANFQAPVLVQSHQRLLHNVTRLPQATAVRLTTLRKTRLDLQPTHDRLMPLRVIGPIRQQPPQSPLGIAVAGQGAGRHGGQQYGDIVDVGGVDLRGQWHAASFHHHMVLTAVCAVIRRVGADADPQKPLPCPNPVCRHRRAFPTGRRGSCSRFRRFARHGGVVNRSCPSRSSVRRASPPRAYRS